MEEETKKKKSHTTERRKVKAKYLEGVTNRSSARPGDGISPKRPIKPPKPPYRIAFRV